MTKISKRMLSSAKKIIEDHKNSNLFLEILENVQSKDEETAVACCSSIGKVLNHFIVKTDFVETEVSDNDKDLSKDELFHQWVFEQYNSACDLLFDLLNSDTATIQISSFDALALILSGLGEKKSDMYTLRAKDIAQKIITALLDDKTERTKLISQLPTLLSQCGNNSEEVLSLFLTSVKQAVKESEKSPKTNEALSSNIWNVVTMIAGNSEIEGKNRIVLNKIVLTFLKQEVPMKLYKDILTNISTVMDKMTSPLLLADFLSQAFNVGGAISLMSLNGLFTLMHKYNLNYPDFYEKLYSMFQPQIFGAKYRARFFHLADIFLSSTHLPSYLIAAFIKRLARLSLHAPASGVQIAVPFIFNLIQRHPACDVLIHRTDGAMEFDSDPYLEDEPPTTCKALESCVWELRTIEHHFDPSIQNKAKKRQIQEEDISNFLERSVGEMMASEAKKRKKDVALTFAKHTDFNLLGKFVL